MGHMQLSGLPRTKAWKRVIELLEEAGSLSEIASATLFAAQKGLDEAHNDPGLVHSYWLLTQIASAARSEDFVEGLRDCGLQISDSPTPLELASSISDRVDQLLCASGGRTDLGEMSQLAAVETVTSVIGEESSGLFGATTEDLQRALKKYSTTRGFGVLSQDFFARFASRYLKRFLECELADHLGPGRRFNRLADQVEFRRALEEHCVIAASIERKFAGEWFSKNLRQGPIAKEKAQGFLYVALEKLKAALAQGAREDVS